MVISPTTCKLSSCISHEQDSSLAEHLPKGDAIRQNDYVTVAYSDQWFPGIVTTTKGENTFTVDFMAASKPPGIFSWPLRKLFKVLKKINFKSWVYTRLC